MSKIAKKAITEEDKIHEEWYKEARGIKTPAALQKFVTKLLAIYTHDYGTICHVIAASAIAAARCVDADPDQGGITGFQASVIMSLFIRRWTGEKGPMRLLRFKDMLYPQYRDMFRQIDAETWSWLQKEAKKELREASGMHPRVRSHMQSIVAGRVPFGFQVAVACKGERGERGKTSKN